MSWGTGLARFPYDAPIHKKYPFRLVTLDDGSMEIKSKTYHWEEEKCFKVLSMDTEKLTITTNPYIMKRTTTKYGTEWVKAGLDGSVVVTFKYRKNTTHCKKIE